MRGDSPSGGSARYVLDSQASKAVSQVHYNTPAEKMQALMSSGQQFSVLRIAVQSATCLPYGAPLLGHMWEQIAENSSSCGLCPYRVSKLRTAGWPAGVVDMAPQVCYTGVTPTTAQHEDKDTPVLAYRRTAGHPSSRRPFVAPKEETG